MSERRKRGVWVKKRQKIVFKQVWKTRYLCFEGPNLVYGKSDFGDVKRVHKITSNCSAEKEGQHILHITTESRELFFKFSTISERDDWCQLVIECIHRAGGEQKQAESEIASASSFDLGEKYAFQEVLGSGSIGTVISVKKRLGEGMGSNSSEHNFAIKKLPGVLQHKDFYPSLLQEIAVLRAFDHDNLLRLEEVFISGNDVYLVTELMLMDAGKLMQQGGQLSPAHAQLFMYQLLRGLS